MLTMEGGDWEHSPESGGVDSSDDSSDVSGGGLVRVAVDPCRSDIVIFSFDVTG